MAELFKKKSDIAELKFINGLSLSKIQHRASKISDNTQDPEDWKYRSFDGFLGDGESWVQRVTGDWEIVVEQFNVTHMDVANTLSTLLLQVELQRKEEGKGPMSIINLHYSPPMPLVKASVVLEELWIQSGYLLK